MAFWNRDPYLPREDADQLWVLLMQAREHGKTLLVPDGTSPQAAVDRTVAVATALSSVQAMPISVGGFVTKLLLNAAAESMLGAVRTVFAVSAIRAVCEYTGVTDPREQFNVIVHAMSDKDVHPDWQPPAVEQDQEGVVSLVKGEHATAPATPTAPTTRDAEWQLGDPEGRASKNRAWEATKTVRRVARLRPDEAKFRHQVLSYVPVVGIVGAAASEQDTMIVIVGKAASVLGLPQPSPGGIRKVTVDVARFAKDQSIGRLTAGVRRDIEAGSAVD